MNDRPLTISTTPHVAIAQFAPVLPPGRIDALYVHWSAHDYHQVFAAYHFCIALDDDGDVVVANTHDVRENMRDVKLDPHHPYAAHTRGRNSFSLGLSIMAMQDAVPSDFGAFPLTERLIDGLCRAAAVVAKAYGVPIDADHVMSHAEAAVIDGYFGAGENQRWDIARLAASSAPLLPAEALAVGDELRARMRAIDLRA